MKKLFLLLILLPSLAWGGHDGSSTSGKEATVTWSYTLACDSAWMVFGYDGDAGDPDSANMYDSLKLVQCFSGTGKELCGDGLDLDSIGSHVVRMYCFSGGSVVGIVAGKWEQKAVLLTAADVWAEDTGGVALTKYGGAVLDYDNYKYGGGADSMRSYLATHDSTLLEQAAACGSGTGARTVTITVKNAADSVAISGFEIDVYDSSSGEPQANGTTNSNGVYTCSLDDETYTVHITNPPWSLTSPRRFVITGNMDSTFYATRFAPGSPPADSLCVVWGRVKDKHGDPYVGAKVSIWMDVYPVTFAGILIDVATKSVVYTDTLGVFEFSDGIYYSSSLNPSNLKWKVRVKTKNSEWIWQGMVAVPSQASWEIEIPDL